MPIFKPNFQKAYKECICICTQSTYCNLPWPTSLSLIAFLALLLEKKKNKKVYALSTIQLTWVQSGVI